MKFSAFEITRYLFWGTGVILVVLGAGSLLRLDGNLERSGLYIFYSVVFFGDALLMWFCAWQMSKKKMFHFFFSVFVLAANIIPTVFDQFGLVDMLFVFINVTTLVFLFISRKEFLAV